MAKAKKGKKQPQPDSARPAPSRRKKKDVEKKPKVEKKKPKTKGHRGFELITTTDRTLEVELTAEEISELAGKMAETKVEQMAEDERQKSARKTMTATMNTLETKLSRYAREICKGREEREVEVEIILHRKNNLVREVRIDTGEVLVEREPTQAELQPELSLDSGVSNNSAYEEGYDACLEVGSGAENPYDPETQENAHQLWNDGWDEAALLKTGEGAARCCWLSTPEISRAPF